MGPNKDQNYPFIRFAQYLSGLTVQQDLWREAAKAMISFFALDSVAYGEMSTDGRIGLHHWNFSGPDSERTLAGTVKALKDQAFGGSSTSREISAAIAETMESGFFASLYFSEPEEIAMAFLPVVAKNQVISVMLLGHRNRKTLSNRKLDTYLAAAGLIGTTHARLSSEIALRRHRDHLEKLVKERTARLTESNEKLLEEIKQREWAEAELSDERDNLLRIFEAMEDRIYIVDSNYTVLYANAAFKKDFSPAVGANCYELLSNADEPCPGCNIRDVLSGNTARGEWFCPVNKKTYDMIETPVKDANGGINMLTLFRDITERKKAREALKARNKELQTALEKVRRLSGLLPICANCKKIRDDAGYWHDVTSYIREHSEVEFSHGICPECLKKLYPEYA